MSDSVTTFKKFRNAKDPKGDDTWSYPLKERVVVMRNPQTPELGLPVEELSDEERVFLRLLCIPRRFKDAVNSAGLAAEVAVAMLRGLLSAELMDTVDADRARAIIPVEVRKAQAELKGNALVRKKLAPNVYRPSLDGEAPVTTEAAPTQVPVPPPASPAPASPAPAATPKTESLEAKAAAVEFNRDFGAIKAEVQAAQQKLVSQNQFEVLGVPRAAEDDAVKAAYLALVRKWHPDRFSGYTHPDTEAVRKQAAALFSAVGEAYRVLADKSSRQAYLRDLVKREESGLDGAALKRAPVRAEEAKLHAQKGKVFLHKRDYTQAESEFKRAVDCDGALAEYRVSLAWCHALNPAAPERLRREESMQMLSEVMAASPRFAEAHYRMGLLLRMASHQERAEDAFRKALEYDPKHEEAIKEVRILGLRAKRQAEEGPPAAAPGEKPKSSLSGLFKRVTSKN